jgi:RHH-type transcriptional regulator, proline utilization regulon repressor / proline dehydrogenase / delta 1-pyrroline-5-carboxylate dehydrogenase
MATGMDGDAGFLDDRPVTSEHPLRAPIREAYRADETACVEALLERAALDEPRSRRIEQRALDLARKVRADGHDRASVETFLHAYGLDTREGVMLMCLAEALLRVPDSETADRLIKDKISTGAWERHLAAGEPLLVNASVYGLMLSGRFVSLDREGAGVGRLVGRLVARLGEPVLRQAILQAMRILGRQFVLGQTIEQAIERARGPEGKGYRYSYDMLGEAARTRADADRYHRAYAHAIDTVAAKATATQLITRPGVSIKLSALHPRYEHGQWSRVRDEVHDRLLDLLLRAKAGALTVAIDAEEADRLEPSLDLLERLAGAERLRGWNGLGIVVQAYQKRAWHVIEWIVDLAHHAGRRIPVRLVKGAYWDTEIKRAQQLGLDGYPVFTRKAATDVAYLACARRLLEAGEAVYAQLATHNAHTVAWVLDAAGARRDLEFQRLHGMGEALYRELVGGAQPVACRVYAPVGSHDELLPYLVRRLLENGANSSFVNRILDEDVSLEELVADPVGRLRAANRKPHPAIPLPVDIYAPERRNSLGFDVSDPLVLDDLARRMGEAFTGDHEARPTIGSSRQTAREVRDPADRRRVVGRVTDADEGVIDEALAGAARAFPAWDGQGGLARAACLERAADLYEANAGELMSLCIREGGKSLVDSIAEVREAVDFLRYYSARGRDLFAGPVELPGPTGESNTIRLQGRGVFLCISPWNFPLAIFTGQVAAALMAGNAVIAKPAEQATLVAARAIELLHEAGVPKEAVVLVPGSGEQVGARLVRDPRIAGVAFTGSTGVAKAINRTLAAADGPIRPLIAETGGVNAMIVDSSALPEQVVADVVESAFRSAGQRCSALRLLCLQDDIADKVLTMLTGAMDELQVGDPGNLSTDVGPVIDQDARATLEAHITRMSQESRPIRQLPLGEAHAHGTFVAPTAFELDRIEQLPGEVFGPVLHVVRFDGDALDGMVDRIDAMGYGLTFGLHTRIDSTAERVAGRIRAGNVYVNRNIIGAVVGTQPFGGEGLSGTGPKAGGPHYLPRFATERVVTVNTAAVGGNLALLSRLEDEL